jgi:hypothetical protein
MNGNVASVAELLPSLRALPRMDKLRLVQFLVFELVKEEDPVLLETNVAYPIWTPYNAFDAAAVLLNALAEEHIVYAQ